MFQNKIFLLLKKWFFSLVRKDERPCGKKFFFPQKKRFVLLYVKMYVFFLMLLKNLFVFKKTKVQKCCFCSNSILEIPKMKEQFRIQWKIFLSPDKFVKFWKMVKNGEKFQKKVRTFFVTGFTVVFLAKKNPKTNFFISWNMREKWKKDNKKGIFSFLSHISGGEKKTFSPAEICEKNEQKKNEKRNFFHFSRIFQDVKKFYFHLLKYVKNSFLFVNFFIFFAYFSRWKNKIQEVKNLIQITFSIFQNTS